MLNISAAFHFAKLDQFLNSWGNLVANLSKKTVHFEAFQLLKIDKNLENDKL
jgi:hypothetical protein